MEENLKVAIVEQIYHGYENELKEIVNKYNIDYKSRNLNFGKLKRADNLKKLLILNWLKDFNSLINAQLFSLIRWKRLCMHLCLKITKIS